MTIIGEDIYREIAKKYPGYTQADIKRVIDVYLDDILDAILNHKAPLVKFGRIGYLHIYDHNLRKTLTYSFIAFKSCKHEDKKEYYDKVIALKRVFNEKIALYEDILKYKEGYYEYITKRIAGKRDHLVRGLQKIIKFEHEFTEYSTKDLG